MSLYNAPDGNDVAKVHGDLVDVGDEERSDRLVQRRAVHIDGGTDGNNEGAHARVHVVVHLQAVKRHRHRCRAEVRQLYVNTHTYTGLCCNGELKKHQ